MNEQAPQRWDKFYLKDVSFKNLMTHRIFNVLIIANPYDAFMLEDDGRVDEKIFNEYTELGLRYPPTFTQVSTMVEASEVLSTTSIDLVICMPGNADNDAFTVARAVKLEFPDIPCVVLTPFSHGITRRMVNEDLSIFEYVFCWLGNTNLILSIIKLIEDKMNLEHDIDEAGVQMILLVEDSIRFYSSILPNLYSYILAQSQRFATEALNPHSATLRMRGRPKVVLARTYEEAMEYYLGYPENILGVISDCRFPKGGEKDSEAGLKLLQEIRKRDPFLPLIIESSEQGEGGGIGTTLHRQELEEDEHRPAKPHGNPHGIRRLRVPRSEDPRGDKAHPQPERTTGQYLQHTERLHALPHIKEPCEPLALRKSHIPRIGVSENGDSGETEGYRCPQTDYL